MAKRKRRKKIAEKDHKRGVRIAIGFFIGFIAFVVVMFSLAF